MAKLEHMTISRRTVEKLSVEKDTVFWDRELPGFGIRVYATGGKVYVAQTRTGGRSRRVRIGRHGVLTPEEARQRAALAITRLKSGQSAKSDSENRAARGPSVAEAAKKYLAEHVDVRLKPNTARNVRIDLQKHILPAFGKLALVSVDRERIAELHATLYRTPAMANRVVNTFAAIYSMAQTWGLVPEGINPCSEVEKYRTGRPERFLTEAEFSRLGRIVHEMEAEGEIQSGPAAAIRLLMLTGCRCNEILRLRWDEVDFERSELRLSDSKTGQRTVPLSPAARRVIAARPRFGQSLGDSGQTGRTAAAEREPVLVQGTRGGRAPPRSAAFVRIPRAGAGREPADDRQAAGSCQNTDHGALCASGGTISQGIGGAGCDQYRGGHFGLSRLEVSSRLHQHNLSEGLHHAHRRKRIDQRPDQKTERTSKIHRRRSRGRGVRQMAGEAGSGGSAVRPGRGDDSRGPFRTRK